METIGVITIIIAAVFVATECRSPPLVTPQPPTDQQNQRLCRSKTIEFLNVVSQNEHVRLLSNDPNAVIDNIDDVCQEYQSASDWLRHSAYICSESIRREITHRLSIGDFLCSENGRSLLTEYQSSVCYSDITKIMEVEGNSEICFVEAISNSQGLQDEDGRCQILNRILACVVTQATEVCGEALGRLVDEIASRALPLITEDECSSESASDILKRGISFFRGG